MLDWKDGDTWAPAGGQAQSKRLALCENKSKILLTVQILRQADALARKATNLSPRLYVKQMKNVCWLPLPASGCQAWIVSRRSEWEQRVERQSEGRNEV